MVARARNHSTEEIEAGASEAHGKFSEFEDSQGYMRHCWEKKINVIIGKNNQLLKVDST